MSISKSCFVVLLLCCCAMYSYAQVTDATKGESTPLDAGNDTLYVFESPRSLVNTQANSTSSYSTFGADILFSGNGYGIGGFYQRNLSEEVSGFLNVGISGARNTSEFEQFDAQGNLFVPFKVNRLFMFPITIGINYRLFQNTLNDNVRPYLSVGLGPTLIFATPYRYDFFESWKHAENYTRIGGFVGLGTAIGSAAKAPLAVNVKYYIIPFGSPGLESIREKPIFDFGGLFIALSIAFK